MAKIHLSFNILIFSGLLFAMLSPIYADTPCWPQFRGPNGSGIADINANPPIEFGSDKNIQWKVAVPSGHSSPAIWANNIFLTGFTSETKSFHTLCIDRLTGKERWRKTVQVDTVQKVHAVSNPAYATPATDGERVYSYFGSYGLVCYDLDGNELWTLRLPLVELDQGGGTSPIVAGNLVILNRDEPNEPKLLSVNRHSGQVVWKQAMDPKERAENFSTPIVWNNEVIVHRMDGVIAFALEDGRSIWSVSIVTNGTSTPVIGDNELFVAAWSPLGAADQRVTLPDFDSLLAKYDSDHNSIISQSEFPDDLMVFQRPEMGDVSGSNLYLKQFFGFFDENKDSAYDPNEWKNLLDLLASRIEDHGLTAVKLGGNGNMTLTHVLWQENKNVPEVPSPLYHNGRVYMIKNGGIVTCMDAKTGKVFYCERLGASGPYFSSPIVAADRIYVASKKGMMTVLKTGDQLEILAKNDLVEAVFATPAIINNTLYVRTTEHLYAFAE